GGFLVCMLCSVGYHLFSCPLSEKKCWVLYASHCAAFWRQVYLVIVKTLILAVFLAQIHPHYHSKEWRHQRTAILDSVAGYGVIPAVHWVWLNGSFSSYSVNVNVLPSVISVCSCSCLLMLNYLVASHQVWHVLVVFMLCLWHQTSVYLMNFRHHQPCLRLAQPTTELPQTLL
uniref:Progestin and adipoQ receptor family member IIIb n=1 Tax=Oncorhynchus mykiss TaxID=8022 RepID=A0A8K9V7X2_ONCMY